VGGVLNLISTIEDYDRRIAHIFNDAGFSCTSFGISLSGDRVLLCTKGLLRYGNCGGNPPGRIPFPAIELEVKGGVLVTGVTAGNMPAALSLSSKELGSTTAVGFDAGGGTGGYCGLAYCN
jgi:hypothetical protein